MNKTPEKFSLDIYGPGIYYQEEVPVEWKKLATASDRCLLGRVRGWLEREIIRELPAGCLWRLWNYELGEMGTFEVSEIRDGWSQITFTGIGFQSFLSDEKFRIKKEHMRNVVEAYRFQLSQSGILPESETESPKESVNQIEEWQPWMHIPDKGEDRKIIELWCRGKTGNAIAKELFLDPGHIHNKVSDLRRENKEAHIPWNRERFKMRFE